MEFFAILIAWAAVQFWGSGALLQHDSWLPHYRRMLRYIPQPQLRLAVFAMAPVLLIALLVWLLGPLVFGLPLFLLSVAVLLYSLGRGDFHIQLRLYLNAWRRGDLEGAFLYGQHFSSELCDSGADNALQMHNAVRKAVFYQGFERWFAVVFWFFLLGPAAALLYRLLFITSQDALVSQDERDLSKTLLYYLEWVPVRLLGFAFALIGDFEGSFSRWRGMLLSELPSDEYLNELGSGSLPSVVDAELDGERFVQQAADELQAVQQLLSRSLLCWVAVMALMQLF
ncbi:regulatory signaling modulator protein AmpE [Spongiibacter sp.]|uniref:regulatory signaling modulator protein AmpE n=1 Tax=Spongiibacter sp. TaxID=2024860 RepID=UPI003561679F